MAKANAINVSSNGVVGFNGTGFTSSAATQYAVLTAGSTSSTITAVGPGTAGQILQSSGNAASPAYSTATYPSSTAGAGKGIIADGTNWVETTPTYQNSSGTAGKFLISDGTNFITSTPTFPNASATSRKIIVSNGTNWVASTETYATPGTNANLMTSDGTNWTSAAPATVVYKNLNVTLQNADLKAGGPILLIPAQGAGTVIVPYNVVWKFSYGGNNAFNNTPSSRVNYGSTYSSLDIITGPGSANFWQTTTGYYYYGIGKTTTNFSNSQVENTDIYFTMSTAATGNAANDNVILTNIFYYVLSI